MPSAQTTHALAKELKRLAMALNAQANRPLPKQTSHAFETLSDALEHLPPLMASEQGTGEARVFAVSDAALQPLRFATNETIYAWGDGSCAPNPGPGGWGVVMHVGEKCYEYSGAVPESTNNIMELTAAIEVLKRVPLGAKVILHSDSRYVVDGITLWIKDWQKKNWRKSDRKPVLNQAYWQQLNTLCQGRQVTWKWVRGHAGQAENERCDALANKARLAV